MSTVQQIEDAIRSLSPAERGRLGSDLPAMLPELDGDAAWERIMNDPRPRPALTALLDDVDAQMKRDPGAFSLSWRMLTSTGTLEVPGHAAVLAVLRTASPGS